MRVNDHIKWRMNDKIFQLCDDSVNGKIITVLGVTFKPNTDDMRVAPSLTIIPALLGAGARVHVVDPRGAMKAWHCYRTWNGWMTRTPRHKTPKRW